MKNKLELPKGRIGLIQGSRQGGRSLAFLKRLEAELNTALARIEELETQLALANDMNKYLLEQWEAAGKIMDGYKKLKGDAASD